MSNGKTKVNLGLVSMVLTGVLFALGALILARGGNPKNMAFCIACFIRDIAGSLKLHTASPVQYFRPEILGIVLGSLIASLASKEYKSTSGSSPMIRLLLGFTMMIGALVFLGCPLRMIIRMGAGDLNAYVALIGFAGGVAVGSLFIKNGYTLGRTYETKAINGLVLPISLAVIMVLVLLSSTRGLFAFSSSGPGSQHAIWYISLIIALVIGFFGQRNRTCFAGSIRDSILIKNYDLLLTIGTFFVVLLIGNAITGNVKFSFNNQPIAHSKHIWNILGMFLVGLSAVLAGGCPFRQLVLAGQGGGDSALTVLGMLIGAAFAHNFNLASAAVKGPSDISKVVLLVCIAVVLLIGATQKRSKA